MSDKRQVVFEGRGGTGKTMILLGLAWRLQERKHARVLLLTYNRVLVADIRRLLTLMGLTDDVWSAPSIEVQTVHAFLFGLLKMLGLLERDEANFLERRYDEHKTEALALLRDRALTKADMEDGRRKSTRSTHVGPHICGRGDKTGHRTKGRYLHTCCTRHLTSS